jgi:hypothetical protein
VIVPYYALTSGHHVNVDRPSRSGSIHEDILFTNSEAKRG